MNTEVVELDGPRKIVKLIWRDSRGIGIQYRFKCAECKAVRTFNHKIDAETALDKHRCH